MILFPLYNNWWRHQLVTKYFTDANGCDFNGMEKNEEYEGEYYLDECSSCWCENGEILCSDICDNETTTENPNTSGF